MKIYRSHLLFLQKTFFFASCFFSLLYFWNVAWSDSSQKYPEGSAHVAIVLDVSKSMNAVDAADMSRLAAAKQYIYRLISENPGYQYGLSIFAGESQRVLPLTQDVNVFATFLSGLNSSNISVQGTDISAALSDAIESFSQEQRGSIILITDGDDEKIILDTDIQKKLVRANLNLKIIGVWSKKWAYIPTWNFASPYELHKGKPVVVKLNERGLKKLASQLWWEYHNYTNMLQLGDATEEMSLSEKLHIKIYLYFSLLFWILFLSVYYIIFYFPEYLKNDETY